MANIDIDNIQTSHGKPHPIIDEDGFIIGTTVDDHLAHLSGLTDDTMIPKPYGTAVKGLAWGFSSQERKPVYSFSLVLLVWTNRPLQIALGMWLCRKSGPRSTS